MWDEADVGRSVGGAAEVGKGLIPNPTPPHIGIAEFGRVFCFVCFGAPRACATYRAALVSAPARNAPPPYFQAAL